MRCRHSGTALFFDADYETLSGKEWFTLPVTGVSWNDAQNFCRWFDSSCSLPTEAQWEYAARAGSTDRFPWGNTRDSLDRYSSSQEQLMPVKSYAPNGLGVYDMIGNAWEWCFDRYDKHYYSRSPDKNPTGPQSERFLFRVVRGGDWREYSWNMRPANRNFGEQSRKFSGVGFRICRNIKQK